LLYKLARRGLMVRASALHQRDRPRQRGAGAGAQVTRKSVDIDGFCARHFGLSPLSGGLVPPKIAVPSAER